MKIFTIRTVRNSCRLHEDPFEALLLQDELQCKYTGGTVLHLYMNEKLVRLKRVKTSLKK
jgi:hypothetical protein